MAAQSNNKSAKTTKAPAPAAKSVPAAVKASPANQPAKAKASYEPTQEEIQTRAFEIYLSEGCKEGNDLEYWLRAEKELRR